MDVNLTAVTGKQRIKQLFRFLQALHQARNPVRRDLKEYPFTLWLHELPEHSCVHLARYNQGEHDTDDSTNPLLSTDAGSSTYDFVLRVQRPNPKPAPAAPVEILDWLLPGWDAIDTEAQIRPQRSQRKPSGEYVEVRFEEDPRRVAAFTLWQQQRRLWQEAERPAYNTQRLFERLYEVYGTLQRESERLELTLGDGILNWGRPDGNIHHPTLIQRLQLDFQPEIPAFSLRLTEHPTEFYTALFQTVPDVAAIRRELEEGGFSPLGGDDTSGFLRSLVARLSARGEFLDALPESFTPYPQIGRAPLIFMRNRVTGFATALESIQTHIAANSDLPASLLRIVGVIEEASANENDCGSASVPDITRFPSLLEAPDVLLSKPANSEQIQIAERLAQHGCVLVQGPPGTGKTHTIANLIGHLLAQGKTILVTSHTAKALRVLREQVVAPLQPLCVSVLESDSAGRSQLEASVGAIVERLANSSSEYLESEANRLAARRETLRERLRKLANDILLARGYEYRSIVIGGTEIAPAEAARRISQGRGQHTWIPGPVQKGAVLPLSAGELLELYAGNARLDTEEERALSGGLPDLQTLPTPDEWERLCLERVSVRVQAQRGRSEFWTRPTSDADRNILFRLKAHLLTESASLEGMAAWECAVMDVGRNAERRRLWDDLITLIQQTEESGLRAERALLEREPLLDTTQSLEEQTRLLNEIYAHLQKGGRLSFPVLLTKPMWKQLIQRVSVKGRRPESTEDFLALQAVANADAQRQELVRRWERQIAALGGPSLIQISETPERYCVRYAPVLKQRIAWHSEVWQPTMRGLVELGFVWERFSQTLLSASAPSDSIEDLRERIIPALGEQLSVREAQIHVAEVESRVRQWVSPLETYGTEAQKAGVADLICALVAFDVEAYRIAYQCLVELITHQDGYMRRLNLLSQLEIGAPNWAAAIRKRIAPHDATQPPGDVERAWEWRQMADELARRDRITPEALEREQEQLEQELRDTTAELVEHRAWGAQIRRTSLPQRQALMGWLNLVRRIGKGTGKRAARLQKEARDKMQACRSAVPVWVMPLSRVVENFDPQTSRFDVVIIDEASQSDAMGLIALYMAHSAVIVGDNEQVSPDAVGEILDRTEHLIAEHLQGIPNAVLYDGQRSLYDIALESFGGHICLTEHFRCAPEIIHFSNALCYNGIIRPLRDMSAVPRRPAVVSYRVPDGVAHNKVNEAEADALISLLIAVTKQPEYAEATFGVISLVGEEQARHIDEKLRRILSPDEYARRRVMCGTPPQFQGDERDVIFLSMVDSPQSGPLSLREDGPNGMWKKRYNVAASRARDQLWVIYSLQPDVDLKPGDIRRRLIEHALDPDVLARRFDVSAIRAESPFEREVIRRLTFAGYRVTPQWQVGRYRLDMVVDDGKKRLAIECDGDRYHPVEKLAEDMARQSLLERLGWTFARIRGSAFYRDADAAMEPIFARLQEMDIAPVAAIDQDVATPDMSELVQRVLRQAELDR
ncbi:MAG TPA: AAA domain-containing protein [Chthonomonadaceae bacterium]|nr:AAA domain-containing protein [Chthonomonadaceae bacterium]